MHKDTACIVSTNAIDTKQSLSVTRVVLPSQFGVTAVTHAALITACGKQLLCITSRPCLLVVQLDNNEATSLQEFVASPSKSSSAASSASPSPSSVLPSTAAGPLVASIKLGDVGVPAGRHMTEFFRGVHAVPGQDVLLVGTSWGEILQFTVSAQTGSNTVRCALTGRLQGGHKSSVSCVTATDRYAFSGDDTGSVSQWELASGKLLVRHDKGAGSPCTALTCRGDLCIAGYASGHIRVLRAGLGEGGHRFMEVEVTAHARAVTGLDWSIAGPTFLSVGEDGLLNVWSLPEVGSAHGILTLPGSGTGPCRLLLDMTARIPNAVLTGACFVCPAGVAKGRAQGPVHIAVLAYDSFALTLFLGLR